MLVSTTGALKLAPVNSVPFTAVIYFLSATSTISFSWTLTTGCSVAAFVPAKYTVISLSGVYGTTFAPFVTAASAPCY